MRKNSSSPKSKQRGWWNFIIPAVASLAGTAMTNKSREGVADDTSQFNAAQAALQRDWSSNEATIARDFNSAQASRQMDFQERMSNTAYQRATQDMVQAGLNPMLAFSQGGASAPAGSSASASAPGGATATGVTPEVSDMIGPAISTAFAARRADQEISNMKAQEDLTRAQRDNVAQDTINKGTQSDQIVATTQQIKQATEKARVDTEVSHQQVKSIIQQVEESRSREDINKVEKILKEASVAEAKAVEQFYKSVLGEANPFVKQLIALVKMFTGR